MVFSYLCDDLNKVINKLEEKGIEELSNWGNWGKTLFNSAKNQPNYLFKV